MISARRRRLDACAVALLALSITTIGIVWGSRTAAGSDAYGYVSQVDLWLRGDLHIDQSFGARVPWPLARWTFLPLGYRPEPDGYRIVPQYPPGLPLLMAAAKLVAGQCAMFWVVPICAGIVVVSTYAIARRLGAAGWAVAAASIVATSPTILFMTIAPMSDVPAAAAWSIAMAGALAESQASAAAAGAAAAAAILIRPNLVVLAAVVALWLAAARQWTRMFWFGGIAAVGAVAVGLINARLYGSPVATGYDLTDGFALAYVATNLRNYLGWLLSAEPALAAGAIGVLAPSARARSLSVGWLAVVWGIYLLYVPWGAWWYLRFLLAAWPVLAAGVAVLAAYAGQRSRGWQVAALAAVIAVDANGLWQASRRETFSAARGESKYVEVARVLESVADPDAVIISAQHSGSIRYYAGRLTLRWDTGDPLWLDRTVDWLAATGHHPYFVLEPQEVEQLRARYGARNAVARLDWNPMVVFRGGAVMMYDAVARDREVRAGPVLQPEMRPLRDCPPQRPWPTLADRTRVRR